MLQKKIGKMDLRERFSVSSSSFLVFNEVLLDAALFAPALATRYKLSKCKNETSN